MKQLLLFFLFLTSLQCFSQTGGESVFKFLNLPTSARQLALGGAALTITDDMNQSLWNPSTIDSSSVGKMAANYTNYLAGINLGSFLYAGTLNEKLGTYHAGFTYLDYGYLTEANEDGVITGDFKAYDLALTFGYAYAFEKLNLKVGANVKLIHSMIASYSSLGVAFDLGAIYKDPNSSLLLSLVVRNAGTQLKSFDGTIEKIPFQISFGASKQLEHVPIKWYATIENLQKWDLSAPNPSNGTSNLSTEEINPESISFLNNASRHFVFGAELFPERKLTLRLGYNYRRSKELQIANIRTLGGFSYGFGLNLKKIQLNYALTKFHPNANSNAFGLIVNLDN